MRMINEEKLKEFKEAPKEKFDSSLKLKFKDGTFMYSWFMRNIKNLRKRQDDLSKDIIKEYDEFKFMKGGFSNKLIELSKMNLEDHYGISKLRFKDGTLVNIWLHGNKYKIINSDSKLGKEVLEKWENLRNPDVIYERRKAEFEKAKEEKFSVSSKLRFKDGTLMNNWFKKNYVWMQSEKDCLSKSIINQYIEHNKLKNPKRYFEIRLYEFEKAPKEKFDSAYKLKFEDGAFMGCWFRNNINKIINDTDEISKSIMRQYENYRDECISKKYEYLSKLKEFEKEESLMKFDENNMLIRFKDGTSMSSWFYKNLPRIRYYDNSHSKEVLKQYNIYISSNSILYLDDLAVEKKL